MTSGSSSSGSRYPCSCSSGACWRSSSSGSAGGAGTCPSRCRRRRGDEPEPVQTRGNNGALVTFFAAPLAIVILLLSFGEVTVNRVDAVAPNPAERLVVTGSQWQWSARYAKEGITVSGKTA